MSLGSSALTGRTRELVALTAALSAAREGKGCVLLVAGEAGVGKTRLVETALFAAELIVIRGRTTTHTTPPYGPIVAALRDYMRQVPTGFVHCGSLSQYLGLQFCLSLEFHLVAVIVPRSPKPCAIRSNSSPVARLRSYFSTICSGPTTLRFNFCPGSSSR